MPSPCVHHVAHAGVLPHRVGRRRGAAAALVAGAAILVGAGLVAGCNCGGPTGSRPDAGVHADAAMTDGQILDAAAPDAAMLEDAAVDQVPDGCPTPLPPAIPIECAEAANRGITWLVAQQQPSGAWDPFPPLPDGGTHPPSPVATTGLAVLKLETHATDSGRSPFDPCYEYSSQVIAGLNYLFSQAQLRAIVVQPGGSPDTDGDGNGVRISTTKYDSYESAIALMAVVAGEAPDRVVDVPGSDVEGWTYRQVAQQMVDYFAFGQADWCNTVGDECGGWSYTFRDNNKTSDMSNTQYVTLALEYAEHPDYGFNCVIPDFVKTFMHGWMQAMQVLDESYPSYYGGSCYSLTPCVPPDGGTTCSCAPNAYRTGAHLQQLAMLGNPVTAAEAQAAVEYLARGWDTYWGAAPSNYLAMWSVMKGLQSIGAQDVGGIDWYADFCRLLVAQQQADGSWSKDSTYDKLMSAQGVLSTEWALLVLEKVAPAPPPIR